MTVSIVGHAVAGDVWERARRLQEKMRTNLAMARDRLDVLGQLSHLSYYLDYLGILYLSIIFFFFSKVYV